MTVLKIDKGKLVRLKTLLQKQPEIQELTTTNPFEAFRMKYENCTMIGYASGKIVVNREKGRLLIQKLLAQISTTEKTTVIGSDEAGKGEWLGPLVVAAVAVRPEQTLELETHGVMDSKELSVERIRELAGFLRKSNLRIAHRIISPSRFNELHKQMKNEKRTLNDLLAWGHAAVIEELFTPLSKEERPIRVIVDEFEKIKTEERLRRVLDLNRIELIQQPNAEENVAVAAASIIARDLREDYLDHLSRKMNTNLRTMSLDKARTDVNAKEYAKVSYLRKE